MEQRFQYLADSAALGMEVVACIIVTVGALVAAWHLLRRTLRLGDLATSRKEIWHRFGVALLLGLEFMLAADIVRTAIAPSWQQIGQLGAIAVIRTFLNYFLEHDLERAEKEKRGGAPKQPLESAA